MTQLLENHSPTSAKNECRKWLKGIETELERHFAVSAGVLVVRNELSRTLTRLSDSALDQYPPLVRDAYTMVCDALIPLLGAIEQEPEDADFTIASLASEERITIMKMLAGVTEGHKEVSAQLVRIEAQVEPLFLAFVKSELDPTTKLALIKHGPRAVKAIAELVLSPD